MDKKKLMVDMDDVICQGGFLYLINKFLGTNYTYDDFKSFYMQDVVPSKDEFFKWFLTQNVYEHCSLLPGCYEVLEELNERYDLYICTSYIFPEVESQSGFILNQKFEYLRKNLPFISPYRYIFASDKQLLDMDIKLDDRVDNLKGADTKLLFSAYHNLDYSEEKLQSMGIERMNSWIDIRDRLLNQ